ncbi:unnamed protein product [Linum tenue]|uniref:25S rRNA (uridine-N(3))-methyltransferase BMT5-like domain-containing protein n=3 Tax=Linum tenue TaxID=586396 RepID=A0AAV0IBB9_9ROSI|nr:unnamed protein product [Linum tenue]
MAYGEDGLLFRRATTHYLPDHVILLVGEGDFSFSLSLARSFGSASNIVATSLDTRDDLMKKYKKAGFNLALLRELGAHVFHGVDATKMMDHPHLKILRFDRIIFNFPHAGFHGKEDSPKLISKHAELVHGFFRNASAMLRRPWGEVHVSHKTTKPYCDWNIVELAFHSFLTFVCAVDFRPEDYPNYSNKRGDGKKADESFHLGECSTFVFCSSMAAAIHRPPLNCVIWGRSLSVDDRQQRLMSLWRLMVDLLGQHPGVAEMRLRMS